MTKDELIQNLLIFLKEKEGIDLLKQEFSEVEMIEKFLLPALKNSKNSLQSLYSYEPTQRHGFIGKLKTYIEKKVSNMVKSNLERQSINQQKFNDVVAQILEYLLIEVKENKVKKS